MIRKAYTSQQRAYREGSAMNRLTLSLFCNQTLKFIHRHRTIIIESLNHITAMLAHMLCHSLILNSLCHDLYRKMMQYIQQTIHNQKIIDIPVWILKKRAISLMISMGTLARTLMEE